MKITFINVGYGEAVLIESNDQKSIDSPYTVLIDGGGNDAPEFEGFPQRIRSSDYLKEKGIRSIDLLINTHIHEDHTCGLSDVIRQVDVKEFWCNYEVPDQFKNSYIDASLGITVSQTKFISAVNSYNDIYFRLKRDGVPIKQIFGLHKGIFLTNALKADILGPSEKDYRLLKSRMDEMYSTTDGNHRSKAIAELDRYMNMTGIMLRFHYHGIKMFLPSDVNIDGYGHLAGDYDLLRADIFKAAHHGQIDGISEELAGYIKPKVVVTCASADRRYNSSDWRTYEIIERSSIGEESKPAFYFSDDVRVKNYTENIITHSAVVIEIDDNNSQVTCRYE